MSFSIIPEWKKINGCDVDICASNIQIVVNGKSFTEVFNKRNRDIYDGPFLSAYPIAEWLASSFWHILYSNTTPDIYNLNSNGGKWWLHHCMKSAGYGFVWPNIFMYPDGNNNVIITSEINTPDVPAKPIRYLNKFTTTIPMEVFIHGFDTFVIKTLKQLEKNNFYRTDLHTLYEQVNEERNNTEFMKYRITEAYNEFVHDEYDEDYIFEKMEEIFS